jgi:hypothetical protein
MAPVRDQETADDGPPGLANAAHKLNLVHDGKHDTKFIDAASERIVLVKRVFVRGDSIWSNYLLA